MSSNPFEPRGRGHEVVRLLGQIRALAGELDELKRYAAGDHALSRKERALEQLRCRLAVVARRAAFEELGSLHDRRGRRSWPAAKLAVRVPDRDARPAGTRRRDHAAGRALDRDEHVRGGHRAQQRARNLGRHRRRRRHDRADRRRPVHPLQKAPQDGWASARTMPLLAAVAGLVLVFLAIETRVESPLLPLRIFRLRTLAGANDEPTEAATRGLDAQPGLASAD